MNEQRDRTVASGFPSPDGVPGPTERLRRLHGDSSEPDEPRYGRSRPGRAATEDTIAPEDVRATTADRARGTADALESFGRQMTSEAMSRAQEELARHGIPRRLQLAGAGAGQLAAAGVLSACATGAFTAGVVMLWNKVLPPWAAALTTAGTFGLVAGPLSFLGAVEVRRSLAGARES